MGWLQRREWLLKMEMSKHEPLERSISHESHKNQELKLYNNTN